MASQLSPELLRLVLSYVPSKLATDVLPQRNLAACRLVCKSWNQCVLDTVICLRHVGRPLDPTKKGCFISQWDGLVGLLCRMPALRSLELTSLPHHGLADLLRVSQIRRLSLVPPFDRCTHVWRIIDARPLSRLRLEALSVAAQFLLQGSFDLNHCRELSLTSQSVPFNSPPPELKSLQSLRLSYYDERTFSPDKLICSTLTSLDVDMRRFNTLTLSCPNLQIIRLSCTCVTHEESAEFVRRASKLRHLTKLTVHQLQVRDPLDLSSLTQIRYVC